MSDEVTKPAETDPEPEGVVEVETKPGEKQRVVSVDVLAAERKRVRESTEQRYKGEIDSLKQKAELADKLQADLQAIQPYIETLKAKPELMRKEESPELAKVNDQEAETFARQYELYTPTGLDVTRAKRIIANQREEMRKVATEAAQQAVQPVQQQTATAQSRANFVWAAQEAQRRGVDPKTVAELWAALPPDLTQHANVAQYLLRTAIGEAVFTGKAQPHAPQHEPIFSEAPGARREAPYQMSPMERTVAQNAGVSEKDWTASAQKYQPDAVNSLED